MFKFAICLLGAVSGLKVVAIGDLHGDYDTALKTYRMADIVDEEGHWVGGSNMTVVQTGDVLDRGNDTIKLFKWIMQLQKEAEQAGGNLVQLLGNHEVMNLEEDYRYVTDQEIDSFGGKEARAEAFSKDGWLGQYLRSLNVTHQIGSTVFVHGGITSDWAGLGVDGINSECSNYLMNDSTKALKKRKIFSSKEDSPLWFRGFSRDTDCDELSQALKALGANRMVMGHTVTSDKKIHAVCDGQGLLIDVGLSSVYGEGHASALELTQDTTQAIYPEKKIPLPHISGLEDQLRNSRYTIPELSPIQLSIADSNSEVVQELIDSNQGPYQEILVEPIPEPAYDSLAKPAQAIIIEPDQGFVSDSDSEYIIASVQSPGQGSIIKSITESSQESSQEFIIGPIEESGYGSITDFIQDTPEEVVIESMPESTGESIIEIIQDTPDEAIIGPIGESDYGSIIKSIQDTPDEVLIESIPDSSSKSILEIIPDTPDETIIGSILEPTNAAIKELMQDSPEKFIIGSIPEPASDSITELMQGSPQEVIIESIPESVSESITELSQNTPEEMTIGSISKSSNEVIKKLMQDSSEEIITDSIPESTSEAIKKLMKDSSEKVLIEPTQEPSYKSIIAPPQDSISELGQGLKLIPI